MTLFDPADDDARFAAAAEFRLSITEALSAQLSARLAPLRPAPLTAASLEHVQDRKGVYELYLDGQRVYVGKASASLADRLGNHHRKLGGRRGIDLDRVRFVCLYVDEDLTAAAPETLLISKYKSAGEPAPWNTNGFGNKDPGRQRDTSVVKANHFDALYPIDLDAPVTLEAGLRPGRELLVALKEQLPYLLRYETKQHQIDLEEPVEVPADGMFPARDLVHRLADTLPPGWQLTALPGYMIFYRENREYGSALRWWRSTPGGVDEREGPARTATATADPDLAAATDQEDVGDS